MMPAAADYSGAALRRLAAQLPEVSQPPTKTAQATALAIRTVLTNVTLADDLDVRAVDADDLLDQFEAATGERCTANTRNTYRAG